MKRTACGQVKREPGAAAFKAVILAGGSGERFWPLSTSEKPKQFLDIFGGRTLIRQSVERLTGIVRPEDVYVVTSAALVRMTRKELPEIPAANIVGEPMRRDTGAAVAVGVGVAGKTDGDVIGFFPADQVVADPVAFRTALGRAIALARKNPSIVTLGIRPTFPATGFGYVNPKTGTFVEKPDAAKARQYLKRGYLWNAGMFIACASTFRSAFAEHAPRLLALATMKTKPGRAALATAYAALPRISFDYAVMEKCAHVDVVPGDFGWDDVGSYLAFDKYFKHDAAGNVIVGDCRAVESEDNICVSCQNGISLLGVRGLVVVSTPDGILVTSKERLGDMKKLFAAGMSPAQKQETRLGEIQK